MEQIIKENPGFLRLLVSYAFNLASLNSVNTLMFQEAVTIVSVNQVNIYIKIMIKTRINDLCSFRGT